MSAPKPTPAQVALGLVVLSIVAVPLACIALKVAAAALRGMLAG